MKRRRPSTLIPVGVAIAAPLVVVALTAALVRAQAPAATAPGPTFEVASIKPNKSGDGRIGIMMAPGGRFTATGVTAGMLITQAYRLQGGRGFGGNNSLLLNAPDWVNRDRFDIVAKAEGNVVPDQFPDLLKSLLIDRFKLTAHTESRELPVYALVLARSDGKLGTSLRPVSAECSAMLASRRSGPPPAGRGGPGDPGPGGPVGAGAVGRGQLPMPAPGAPAPCGNMRIGPGNLSSGGTPIALLVNSLSGFAGRTVIDRTGLAGDYQFDLQWTPDQMPGARGDLPPGVQLPPIDPNGPSIFTAVQEQLGLKLESTRAPVDVLVIDRVEPPTED